MKNIIILISILLSMTGCEEKPDNDFFGFPAESKGLLLTGLLNNTNFTNSAYGTVIDAALNVEFKKCSQGQTWNQTTGGCDAATANAVTKGALSLSYCNSLSNACNTVSPPFTLKDPGTAATSEAWDSCKNDRTGGFSDWRVANGNELLKLVNGGRNMFMVWFPATPENNYWSANADESDAAAARAFSFSAAEFGAITSITKDTRLYVRCVRNR